MVGAKSEQTERREKGRGGGGVLGKQAAPRSFTEAQRTGRERLGPWTASVFHRATSLLTLLGVLRPEGAWPGVAAGRILPEDDFSGPTAKSEFHVS